MKKLLLIFITVIFEMSSITFSQKIESFELIDSLESDLKKDLKSYKMFFTIKWTDDSKNYGEVTVLGCKYKIENGFYKAFYPDSISNTVIAKFNLKKWTIPNRPGWLGFNLNLTEENNEISLESGYIPSTLGTIYESGFFFDILEYDYYLDGKFEFNFANGALMSSGELNEGKKNGHYIEYNNLGKLQSENNFKNGVYHGKQTLYLSIRYHVEYYENGEQVGYDYTFENDGTLFSKCNNLDSCYYYYPDGKLKGTLVSTNSIYSHVNYFQNGNISESYSTIQVLNEQGRRSREKKGLYLSFYEDGQIYIKEDFLNGNKNPISRIIYYPNGNIKSEHYCKIGLSTGTKKEYDEQGQLIKESITEI